MPIPPLMIRPVSKGSFKDFQPENAFLICIFIKTPPPSFQNSSWFFMPMHDDNFSKFNSGTFPPAKMKTHG